MPKPAAWPEVRDQYNLGADKGERICAQWSGTEYEVIQALERVHQKWHSRTAKGNGE